MNRKGSSINLHVWLVVRTAIIFLILSSNIAWAQNGSSYQRTVTFAEGDGSANFTFEVRAPKFSGTETYIWLELGSDGITVPSGATVATIAASFSLSLNSTTNPITVGTNSSTLFTNKTIVFEQEDPSGLPNFYKLKITHNADVTTSESWTFTVSSLPSSGPPLTRAVAFAQQAILTSVDPTGPSGGGDGLYVNVNVTSSGNTVTFSSALENADSATTYTYQWFPENQASIGTWSGETTPTLTFTKPANVTGCCKLVTFRVEVRKSSDPGGGPVTINRGSNVLTGDDCNVVVGPPWPPFDDWEYIPVCINCPTPGPWPPGPVCLSCPPEWSTPILPDFERSVFAFTPYNQDGKLLGPDKGGLIRLNLKQGKTVGGIIDQGNGTYLQVIEYPKGSSPQASLAVGEVTSKEFSILTRSAAVARYKNIAYVLGALFVISLLVNGLLARRGLLLRKQTSG